MLCIVLIYEYIYCMYCCVLCCVQMYSEAFEIEFLLETETIYHSESLRMMRDPEFTVSAALSRAGVMY